MQTSFEPLQMRLSVGSVKGSGTLRRSTCGERRLVINRFPESRDPSPSPNPPGEPPNLHLSPQDSNTATS